MSDLRIVFMGTGDIALPSFSVLLKKQLVALITQPDKPVGRKQILTPPKIKELAIEHHIPVMQPEKARDEEFLSELKALEPDVIVVMAYGQILTQAFLDIPKVACINLHASLLPKYRGAACIQAAIDAGDEFSGITIMHVVKALDAGDMILKKKLRIGDQETGGELHDRLADLGPEALLEVLEILESGDAAGIPQDEAEVSYISKLMRDDGQIDWSQDAVALERRIRAYDPWPGTSTTFTDKKGRARRLKIFPQVTISEGGGKAGEVISFGNELQDGSPNRLHIACGKGSLIIENLQPDGSRRMTADEFLKSAPLAIGDILGQ